MNLMGYNNQVNQLTGHEEVISEMIEIPYANQDQEIHQDLQVTLQYYTTIWGRLTNHENHPLPGECVKLVRIDTYNGRDQLEVVDVATTDEQGCYELSMRGNDIEHYSIIVHKQALARENVENQIKQMNASKAPQKTPRVESKSYTKEKEIVRQRPSYYEETTTLVEDTKPLKLEKPPQQCERFYGEYRRGGKGNLAMYRH